MSISSADWVSYSWKNELKKQADRVVAAIAEVLDDDFHADHSPLDMLERAAALAAFSMRRMIEKRLVTDALAAHTIKVRSFAAKPATFRQPYHRATGGNSYANYLFSEPVMIPLTIKKLAHEIIHSSQLMVIAQEEQVEDGLLIASDNHLATRLLHLTASEFMQHVNLILDDRVCKQTDSWNPETGKVSATRE